MDERPRNGWQAWLAGALFLGVLAAALLIGQPKSTPPTPPPATLPKVAPTQVLPRPQPPLDRADLIEIAQKAASAFATGGALQQPHSNLVGRRFELRLPFGCAGPASDRAEAQFGWSYDRGKGSLRAFAVPQNWSDTKWVRQIVEGKKIERAEGFPIERPWILEPVCPSSAKTASMETGEKQADAKTNTRIPQESMAADPADTIPELALVELFTADAPRSAARGDRSYVAIVKRPPESVDPSLWFTLVLSGRLATFPDEGSVQCWGDASATRPRCLIAAQIDRAAIVDRDGLELAEWVQ